ncbi:MAG: hypothetical protein QOI38_2264 [Sphingomonadales bacterium]|jgi:hypothetical protein|nr:hypothetical protein [Sphingomonadales bacterium]
MMRCLAAAALVAGTFAAAPASATQGQLCRPVSAGGPSVSIVTGAGLVGVSLSERGTTLSTMGPNARIATRQSWFDALRVWIDLTDPNAMRDEGRLRLHYVGRGRGRHLAGTLARNGRLYRLRCEES